MMGVTAISQIWITLGPIVVINAVLFVSYVTYQLWVRKKHVHEFQGVKKGGSQFLSSATREWWFWTTDPIVRLFVKLKLGPNAITAMGFFFSLIAAVLFAKGWFGYGGWAMMFGASFDMFDGRVARITGRASRSGAFFDAVMDRFGEGACLLGLAVYFRSGLMLPIVILALIGSLLVSYTKARAEGIGVECNVGAMQRPERIVYLGVASVFDPIANALLVTWWSAPPPILVILALVLIAVMTNYTAVQRMIHVMNALDTADRRGKDSIPQIIAKLSTQAGREKFWEKARYGYDRSRSEFPHVVLFLMGGVVPDIMHTLMKRGDLPNIAAHILERGGEALATATFPSTTGPSSTPFVTGAFPGTCDIPGSQWFDRSIPASRVLTMKRFRDYLGWGAYAMDRDLSKSIRTVFEYSRQAVNIFGMLNRGCGFVRDPAFFRLYRRFHGARREEDVNEASEAAFSWFTSAIRRETDFVLYMLPSVDFTAVDEPVLEYACHAYRRIDDYIGRAAAFLKDQGMYDETALLFCGAHGHGEARRKFDITGFFSVRHRTCASITKFKDWQDAEVLALPSGTSMAHIYVRKGPDWKERSFFEDVERRGIVGSLLEQDGADILAGRSIEGGVVVQTRRGRAHVHEDADGRITYMPKGGDPFGFANVSQVQDNTRQEFDASQGTAYPDGILQVLQVFRSRRAGDLVVSADSDTTLISNGDLNVPTHGSLAREHMIVPFMSSVPIEARAIRTVDVFEIIMDMLGIDTVHLVDGEKVGVHYGNGFKENADGRREAAP